MVYNDTISVSKANKQHIDNIDEKVSSSGGDNKLRTYLVYFSDAAVDINEVIIPNINVDTIFNSNVNMAVAS